MAKLENTMHKEEIYKRLSWIIIGVGIILRVSQYLYNRSLTEGEAALALNIVGRSYSGLLKPLDYVQGAPVGFLILQRALVELFGNNEYALRCFPLIAGVVSLFLFYWVAQKTINRTAVPIGLTLFAVCDHLIYFSSEIKQYSSDVAVALLLILITINIFDNNYNTKYIILLGIGGAISIWFSHPSVFTFGAGIIILLVAITRNKRWDRLWWLVFACLLFGASLVINYFISLEALSKNRDFLDFWQHSFMPIIPRLWSDIRWFAYSFLRLFKNPVGLSIYELLLAVLSFFVGSYVLWHKNRKLYAILILPILLTLAASGLQKYPFEGRLLLFIVPSMVLVIAQGIDFIRTGACSKSKVIGSLLVVILLLHPVGLAGYHLIKPRAPEELRPVLQYLKVHKKKGDVICLYYASVNAFRYYSARDNFSVGESMIINESQDAWHNYYRDLARLKGNERVWILFSHIITWRGVDEERLFLSYLNLLGTQLDAYKAPGASAYLYNLKEAP